MQDFDLQYIEPVFRPPSEANSLILQVTNGCSWSRCTFCEMYTEPQKEFNIKKSKEIIDEIRRSAQQFPSTRRVFLADGDAMVLSTRRLLSLLTAIRETFPSVTRVSSYCLPRNVRHKSVQELQELRDAGLGMLYVGVESGDDKVLRRVNKGETRASCADALLKIKTANIKSSVMILNGLGGADLSRQHALHSAHLINEVQPDFLSILVVSLPLGEKRFRSGFPANFRLLDKRQLFQELGTFIANTELDSTVFRSDHASNYLALKGVLRKDKGRLLSTIDNAIHRPDTVPLRPEWLRGL